MQVSLFFYSLRWVFFVDRSIENIMKYLWYHLWLHNPPFVLVTEQKARMTQPTASFCLFFCSCSCFCSCYSFVLGFLLLSNFMFAIDSIVVVAVHLHGSGALRMHLIWSLTRISPSQKKNKNRILTL